MDIRSLPKAKNDGDPFRHEAGLLIETVGTPSFEQHLFRLAWDAVRCEHLSAFAQPESGAPRMLLSMGRGRCELARSVGTAYVSRYWQMDPINRIATSNADVGNGIAMRVTAEELLSLPYRRELYSNADWATTGGKFVERLSMAKRQHGEIVRINFYRHRSVGPFEQVDLDRLAGSADILFALLAKHSPPKLALTSAASYEAYRALLQDVAPDLSPREAEVCAGIAVGMTSEAIASRLGIRLNTVLTYRKRAYARLNISSQLELLRLVFSAVVDTRAPALANGPH